MPGVRVETMDEGQHLVAFGQVRVEGYGTAGSCERLFVPVGIRLLACIAGPGSAEVDDSAELGPGWSVARIEFQGLDQKLPGFVEVSQSRARIIDLARTYIS